MNFIFCTIDTLDIIFMTSILCYHILLEYSFNRYDKLKEENSKLKEENSKLKEENSKLKEIKESQEKN
jgi:cell division protein FtsB